MSPTRSPAAAKLTERSQLALILGRVVARGCDWPGVAPRPITNGPALKKERGLASRHGVGHHGSDLTLLAPPIVLRTLPPPTY